MVTLTKIAHGLILETDAQADITGEYYLTGAINMCTSKLSKNGVNFFDIHVTKIQDFLDKFPMISAVLYCTLDMILYNFDIARNNRYDKFGLSRVSYAVSNMHEYIYCDSCHIDIFTVFR